MDDQDTGLTDSEERHGDKPQNAPCGSLVPVNRVGKIPLVPVKYSEEGFGRLSTCLDLSTISGRVKLFNLLQSPGKKPEEVLGKQLDLIGWATWDWRGENEDSGELVEGVRYALICADGYVISGVSDYVVASLRLLATLEGVGPWEKPIPVKIAEARSRKGRRYNTLVRVE